MKVLGIETSTFALGIGVIQLTVNGQQSTANTKVNFDFYTNSGVPESESIIEIIKKQLPNPEEIDGIGVSIGPGSFTGLRIGLATAKGLGIGLKRPVVGVPTLDAFPIGVPQWGGRGNCPYKITPILDARNENVYTASYEPDGKRITPYIAVDIEEFLENLKDKHIFVGNGVKLCRDLIQKKLGKRAHFISPNPDSPRGVWIASLALEYLMKLVGQGFSFATPFEYLMSEGEGAINSLEPIYLSQNIKYQKSNIKIQNN